MTIIAIFADAAQESERQIRVRALLSRQMHGTVLFPAEGFVSGNTPFYQSGGAAQDARVNALQPSNGIIDPDGYIGDRAALTVSATQTGPTPAVVPERLLPMPWDAPKVDIAPAPVEHEPAPPVAAVVEPVLVHPDEVHAAIAQIIASAPVVTPEGHVDHASLWQRIEAWFKAHL